MEYLQEEMMTLSAVLSAKGMSGFWTHSELCSALIHPVSQESFGHLPGLLVTFPD